jgi:hypothetical protein
MGQSPSWESNRSSASQDIFRILWNPNVPYRIHKSPPPVPILSYRKISSSPWVLCLVCNMLSFYGLELLAIRPTPKLKDHPLSAVNNCLFNILAAFVHIWRPISIRNLRKRHAVVTGTHLWRILKANFLSRMGSHRLNREG